MKIGFRKGISVLLMAALAAAGIPETLSAAENGVSVSTREEFMTALSQKKSPITVNGLITIGKDAEASGRMLPVTIPAATEIRGEGTTGHLNCRSPIQLEGDVNFQNMELTFESSNALGSVPHREIFLAGHGLTLDNVKTWLEGANGDWGSLGGSEEELLPTVYAGGFTNTAIGGSAALTVRNSNDKTMFQAVYMSHDEGNDNKVPYYGDAQLNLDAQLTVREKVDVSRNARADMTITGGGYDNAKTKQITGNDNTTLTLRGGSLSDAVLENVGSVILEGACLSPKTNKFNHVTLRQGGCLDLNGVSDPMNAIISGNFTGVSDPAEERGILVVNQESSLTIEGRVTGTTQFQTYHRLFPGTLLLGWPYISVNREYVSRTNFVLAQKSIDNYGYQLKYSDGLWTVVKPAQEETKQIGSIEISSAPSQVLLDSIMRKLDGSVPNENVYFDIVWKDVDGNDLSPEEADDRMLYESDCVLGIKSEYWESDDPAILAKTDWGNAISLMPSDSHPGRYYLQAEEEAKAGEYTFLFCSDYISEPLDTVQDVKNLGNLIRMEKSVTFLDQKPEPEETPAPSESPIPTKVPAPTEVPDPSTSPVPTGEVPPDTTATPEPEESPKPTKDPGVTEDPGSTKQPDITETPGTPETPEPGESIVPTENPGYEEEDQTPEPAVHPPERILLSGDTFVYTGKARKPKVTVKDTAGKIIGSQNYELSYAKNRNPGQASVTIRFLGMYKGTMTKTFQIVPKGTKLSRLTAATRGFTARWRRQRIQTTGYELQYSVSKKFEKRKTKKIVVKGNKKVSRRITGTKPGKKYFVRIRTYKSVKTGGRTNKFYSAWSGVKAVRSTGSDSRH